VNQCKRTILGAAAGLAMLSIGGGLALALSAAPTTAPADRPIVAPWQDRRPFRPEGMRPDGPRSDRPDRMRPGEWWRANNPATRPVGPDEFQDIDRFMRIYSPKRWARLKDVPDDRQERLRGFVAARYRNLQDLKQNDPKMYDLRLVRMQIEDQIFDLGWQLKDSPEKAESIRSTLREQVGKLVDNRLEERRLRVQTLREKLDLEQNRLAAEEAHKDAAIESSLKAIDRQHWPGMGEMVPPVIASPGEGSQGSKP
jgi:hypothetical protein